MAGFGQAEVGRLIGQHHVGPIGQGLNQDVIADIARGKIKRPRGAEELGSQAFHLQSQRTVAIARAAGGRMNAVAAEGLAARMDHLGMAGQAQVAGAAKVEIFLAVDASECTGRTFHQRRIGPGIHAKGLPARDVGPVNPRILTALPTDL